MSSVSLNARRRKRGTVCSLFNPFHPDIFDKCLIRLSHAFCQSTKITRGDSPRKIGGRSGVHASQTDKTTFSHLTRVGVCHQRAVGGRSHRSGEHCQIQSRLPLSADGGGRVVQVRMGGARQIQDWQGPGGCVRKILKWSDRRTPRRLQTDDGKEFYNKTFKP